MIPPPLGAPPRPFNRIRPAEQRREMKRGRRAVLVQCDRCLCNGTARVSAGRVVSVNLAATFERGRPTHRDCGGSLIAFDIEVES